VLENRADHGRLFRPNGRIIALPRFRPA